MSPPNIFPIAPKHGMISFTEAIVVIYLYRCFDSPDDDAVIDEIEPHLELLMSRVEDQRQILVFWVSDGHVICYSKSTKRPMEITDALDLISAGQTDNIIIYGHDLLFGDRHPANLLPKVLTNAKTILGKYPFLEPDQPTKLSTAPRRLTHKLRRNSLDTLIDKAIQNAGSSDVADVYRELKELALAGTIPFTGIVEKQALCYTNDMNESSKLSKSSLRKRLNRRNH